MNGERKYPTFICALDSTAEKNPLLWLPCVLLLTAFFGTDKLIRDLKTAFGEEAVSAVETAANEIRPMNGKKSLAARTAAFAAAVAITFGTIPNLADIHTFADNEPSTAETKTETEEEPENKDSGEDIPQKSSAEEKAPAEKNAISVNLECDLINISSGTAHIETRARFLENSADVRLSSTDSAKDAAKLIMRQLGDNALYYNCYPFDIGVYDADSGEEVTLINDGFITFEMPIPKIMKNSAERIKVYHIKNDYPELVESEFILAEDGSRSIQFSAAEFSSFMFIAPAAEDVSSGAGETSEGQRIPDVMPISAAKLPVCIVPQRLGCSERKRRYRILRKRRLDDMVFVY